jgi:hypothetical protein
MKKRELLQEEMKEGKIGNKYMLRRRKEKEGEI